MSSKGEKEEKEERENEKLENSKNIQVSFIGEGGGRAILRFHSNTSKDTKTTIWHDAKIRVRRFFEKSLLKESRYTIHIQVRRRTSTRGASPFERQHSPGSLWGMFQGLIRPKNARSDSNSSSTSRRLFVGEDEGPPLMSLPPPMRKLTVDEVSCSAAISSCSKGEP